MSDLDLRAVAKRLVWFKAPEDALQEKKLFLAHVMTYGTLRDLRVVLEFFSESDLNAWRFGHDHDEIATTPIGPRGYLRISVHDPDTYIAIENRGSRTAGVRLRVFLERANVRYLSRRRHLAVILISFGVFFAIVTFSARRLLKAIRR